MKSAIEIAKEVLAWPCDAQNDVPQIVPLAEAVVKLTEDWEAENQALNVLRSICKGKSQAMKEAEQLAETLILSEGFSPNLSIAIAKEWLAKYGEKK